MNSMVGADFGSKGDAQSAAAAVRAEGGVDPAGLCVIEPGDPQIDRKLEPEGRRIFGTLLRAHLMLGVVGLVLGFVVALVLIAYEVRPFALSPIASISVMTGFGAIGGLLLGGLFTLRPDHDPLIHRAKSATESGRWFVVVHTCEPEQRRRAERILSRFSENTLRTI
jgi:hypothetical protein